MRVACLLLLLLWAPSSVCAQATPSSSDRPSELNEQGANADAALREALQAYEAGELPRAERLLSEVHAQQPSARTLRGLGIVAYRQARYPEAVSFLERSLVHPIKPLTPALETGVRELVFDAVQRVGKLELTVTPDDALIQVDGAQPARGALGVLILVPGGHELELSAYGRESVRLGISASAGVKQSMRVELRPQRASITPAINASRKPDLTVRRAPDLTLTPVAAKWVAPESPRPKRLRRASYVMLALTGAALVTAGVATLRAQSKISEIEDYCRGRADKRCEEGEVPQKERAANIPMLEKLATASLITAGVTGVAGGALYLTAWRSESKPRPTTYLLGFKTHF